VKRLLAFARSYSWKERLHVVFDVVLFVLLTMIVREVGGLADALVATKEWRGATTEQIEELRKQIKEVENLARSVHVKEALAEGAAGGD